MNPTLAITATQAVEPGNPCLIPQTDPSHISKANPHDSPRLLLVSSNSEVGAQLSAAAQAVGFDCDICLLSHALALLKSRAYHAAVVDVGVPEETLMLIEQVRVNPSCKQVPIVALTDPGNVNTIFRSGASFTLARPIAPDLLKNTLGAIYRIAEGLRRQYARYGVELPITLTANGRLIEAKATDVGTGGIALVAAEPLESGTVVTVQFDLPGTDQPIVGVGEIRWSDHQGRAGLFFNSFAGNGRALLESWMARRHAGIEEPAEVVVRKSEPSPAPRTLATTPEAAKDPAGRSARVALTVILTAFSVFVLGFWIYIALTS